jgi:mono/diheme cytochrome c family protein
VKWGRWLLLAGTAILAALLLSALFLVRHGISAREEPTRVEAFLARRMRHWAIPADARSLRNPVPAGDEALSAGREHFADHCATCHGNDGRGRTEIGQNLYPKAPDMTLAATQDLRDGEIFYIIRNGIRLTGMPAWGEGDGSDDAESWHLVHFIRHLPAVTPEELEQMKQMNPRSLMELRAEELERRFLEGEDVPDITPGHRH